jgi:hypothetical protein
MSSNFDTSNGRVIDFVHPLQYAYANAVHPDHALYAQAGFPGYDMQAMPPSVMMPATLAHSYPFPSNFTPNLGSNFTPNLYSPNYNPNLYTPSLASSYNPTPNYPTPNFPNLGTSYPQDPTDLHQRIETKMDSILNAQKTEALSNQIEKLSEQVSGLSRKVQCNEIKESNNSEEAINGKLKAILAESKKQEAW